MTILITGARGAVGAGLLRRLHGHEVRAASRVPEQLGVPAVELDLSRPETFAPALAGVRGVFLYAEPAGITELLHAAESEGVEQIVLLSSAAVAESGTDALAHHHLLVEQAVLAANVRTTLLRPGAFDSNALGWCEPIRTGRPVEQAYPDARIAPIHAEDIVDVAELAITTDKLDGQAITLVGPESLSFREQLAILGDLLGRRIEITELTHEQGLAQLSRYMPAPAAESLLGYWAASLDGPASTTDAAERITGIPGRTFRTWATENLAAFRRNLVSAEGA
ncbi:SDR family oxidoreductase [Pseudonocardia spinosispora]|uniref:SDR family oxidoreductase n=1 Tax=Pseudonocardia spinosispora TaxID=103441 RepID=UPI0003F8F60B|nr:NAD(P)H-binding protein [Pseudonocardia spinosispora]